jgi:SAM-dependent methyltransferase
VTQPLPGAPFDLIYARFVLAHLPDAPATVANWTAALAPGGSLVLEETEHISTDDPGFSEYEALVRRRVGITGAQVYAGSLIRAVLPARLDVVVDRVLQLDITAADAAAMFRRNLEAWGSGAVGQGLISESGRAALLGRLSARESDDTRGCFDWTHRQLVAR